MNETLFANSGTFKGIVRSITKWTLHRTFRRDNVSEQLLRFSSAAGKTKRPVILTVNGKAAAVVQDAVAYQRLLDIAAQADALEGIRLGREDVAKRRTYPSRDALGPSTTTQHAGSLLFSPRLTSRQAAVASSSVSKNSQ